MQLTDKVAYIVARFLFWNQQKSEPVQSVGKVTRHQQRQWNTSQ